MDEGVRIKVSITYHTTIASQYYPDLSSEGLGKDLRELFFRDPELFVGSTPNNVEFAVEVDPDGEGF